MVTTNAALTELERAKKDKKRAIDEERGKHFLPEYIEYMGHKFDLTLMTYTNLTAATAFAGFVGTVGEGFVWFDYYNEPVPMTTEDFRGFILLVKDILQYGFYHAAELKRQVDACTLVEQVAEVPNW